MPTDRDSLARTLFTLRPESRYQTWEQTSAGIRLFCKHKADALIVEGWGVLPTRSDLNSVKWRDNDYIHSIADALIEAGFARDDDHAT